MTFKKVWGEHGKPDRWFVDGCEVSEWVYESLSARTEEAAANWPCREEALAALADLRKTAAAHGHKGPYFNLAINDAHPLKSEALACHPKQIAAIRARNAKHGLDIPYDRHGRPVFTDAGQRKKLMKIEGVRQQNSYYGA